MPLQVDQRQAKIAASLPVPTLPQLRYAKSEIVAIFGFSGDNWMPGGMGCGGFDPTHFKPTETIDYNAWTDLADALGAGIMPHAHYCNCSFYNILRYSNGRKLASSRTVNR